MVPPPGAALHAVVNPRTTGILFLAAAALAAFVYFYEIRGEAERVQAEEATKRLFPGFEAAEVTEVSLTTSDGYAARALRRDAGWELVEPIVFPADVFALDGMASALADLKSESVFENPQPAEVYGLDDDTALVRFAAGGEERQIRLGKAAPVGTSSYASVGGSEAVYTVPRFGINALRKSLFDLREKRIARFDRNAVDRISASWPGGRVALEKGDDGWRITEPIEDRADPKVVDSLLSDLSFLRAEGFEDEPPPDAEAGLDPPDFAVELHGAGDDEAPAVNVSLAIGSALDGEATGGGSRLVRADQPSLFRIASDRLADLPRELVAYRWKQLASFSPTDAEKVEIHFEPAMSTEVGDEPVLITATRADTGWTSEPESFAPGKVVGMISALSNLVAADILADEMGPEELAGVGLAPPIARIVVHGAEGEEPLASIRLGVVRGDEGIVAQSAGNAVVFELDHGLAERVPVSLEAFRNRFLATEPAPEEAEPPLEAAEPDLPDPGLESP